MNNTDDDDDDDDDDDVKAEFNRWCVWTTIPELIENASTTEDDDDDDGADKRATAVGTATPTKRLDVNFTIFLFFFDSERE